MINLEKLRYCTVWPEELARIEGEFLGDAEPFSDWRERTRELTGALPNEVCEQWVYRHGTQSPFTFLDLSKLHCEEQVWPAHDFPIRIGTFRGNEAMTPEHDFKVFNDRYLTGLAASTASTLNAGKWEYAPVVLSTAGGFICSIGEHINKDFLLIEGHKRFRYLYALLTKGVDVEPQRVWVLTHK